MKTALPGSNPIFVKETELNCSKELCVSFRSRFQRAGVLVALVFVLMMMGSRAVSSSRCSCHEQHLNTIPQKNGFVNVTINFLSYAQF